MNSRITPSRPLVRLVFSASIALLPIGSTCASPSFKLPVCPAQAESESEKKVMPTIQLEDRRTQVAPESAPDQEKTKESEVPGAGALRKSGAKDKKLTVDLNHFDRAKNINLVPLSLIPSKTEFEERKKLTLERHKEQLKDLWTAAIERSPDIQFAISVLQPNSNPKHATAAAMRLVSGALFNVGGTLAPNGATRAAVSMGSPIIDRLFQQEKGTPAITVGETLVLYKMVRDIADNLVSSYWSYRKAISERDAAETDLTELKGLMKNILQESSFAEAAHFQYLLHKSEREIQVNNETVGIYEQHLLDLCGQDAMAKLQLQLVEERNALTELVGRPDINDPLSPPSESTAKGTERH